MIKNIIDSFLQTIFTGAIVSLIFIYLFSYLITKIAFDGLTVMTMSFLPPLIIFTTMVLANGLGLRNYYLMNKNVWLYEFLCLFVGNFFVISLLDSFYFYIIDDSLSIAYSNATLNFYDETTKISHTDSIKDIQEIKNMPLLLNIMIFNIPVIFLSSLIVTKMKLKKRTKKINEV